MLFRSVSRFAHYLKCMVRDKIGSYKEQDELVKWLQTWINEYVDPNPAVSSEVQKARKASSAPTRRASQRKPPQVPPAVKAGASHASVSHCAVALEQ